MTPNPTSGLHDVCMYIHELKLRLLHVYESILFKPTHFSLLVSGVTITPQSCRLFQGNSRKQSGAGLKRWKAICRHASCRVIVKTLPHYSVPKPENIWAGGVWQFPHHAPFYHTSRFHDALYIWYPIWYQIWYQIGYQIGYQILYPTFSSKQLSQTTFNSK